MSEPRNLPSTVETPDQRPPTQENGASSLDVFVSEFAQEAGKHVGNALAEEIHRDPQTRRAAATGAGVGVGVVAAVAVIALLAE